FLAPPLCTSLAHFLRGVLISFDDVYIAGAAAEIAGDGMTNLVVSRVGVFLQKSITRHQHTRRAVATLQAVFLVEAVLQWMQLAVLFESFDCQYRTSVRLHGECCARLDGFAVQHHCAGAAVDRKS